jgi:uncharacterized repeat protein (TIGR01451 family)
MLVNAAGGVVSFLSDASDLVADDANHLTDVFVWNDGVVVAGVDLALNKTASTSVAGECLSLTYMLAVTNHGTAPATGVRLTDTLPAGMTFFSASTTQGSVTNSGGTITAQVGSLNVGAGARVSVIVTATSTGSIVNTAVATANEADVTPANNMSSIAVTVTPLVSPAISLIASNAAFHLTWPSSTPNVFLLQCATNLTPTIAWRTLTNVINDNGSVKSLLITNDLFAPERYYRLRKQ